MVWMYWDDVKARIDAVDTLGRRVLLCFTVPNGLTEVKILPNTMAKIDAVDRE